VPENVWPKHVRDVHATRSNVHATKYNARVTNGVSMQQEQMIEVQIKGRGINDPQVIAALYNVRREQFVPKDIAAHAYEDRPLPIGFDQTISQPYIVAFMTEAAQLKSLDRVLEVGTGSGYQAAVLSKIVKEVFSIEIVEPLGIHSKELLSKLGYRNIQIKIGDGYQGWKEHAPFDAILVTAAPPEVPSPLIEQLKLGGRLVLPIGREIQDLVRITKTKTGLKKETLLSVRFVPMTGEAQIKRKSIKNPKLD